jgi:histidine triad (HIT) family protein
MSQTTDPSAPPTTDASCLFCRIVAGEIPAEIVARSDAAVAFRDINPQAPTHVLVIPRRHVENAAELADASPQELAAVIQLGRQVAQEDGIGEGYRFVFNNGKGAGQEVFHVHLHVIGGRSLTWPPG